MEQKDFINADSLASTSELDYNGFQIQLHTTANTFYGNQISSVTASNADIQFFDPEQTALADDEILLTLSDLMNLFGINIDDYELQGDDRYETNYSLSSTYDDNGNIISYKLETFENECYHIYELQFEEAMYDYALNNLPTSELFEEYIDQFYATPTEWSESGYATAWDYFDGEIGDDLKAYAYMQILRNSYLGNNQFSEELCLLVQDYAMNEYEAEENIFGGKKGQQIRDEAYNKILAKYLAQEDFTVTGTIGLYTFDEEGYTQEPEEKEYHVVGIYTVPSNDIYNSLIVSDSLFQEFRQFDVPHYSALLVHVENDDALLKRLVDDSYSEENRIRFFLNNAVHSSISSFNNMIEMLAQVFLFVGIGLAVFSALLLMNFISASITYKKREIGILRAVGAKSSDVFKIFFSEAFVIAIINFVIAAIGAGIGAYFFNDMVVTAIGSLGSFFIFGIRQIAIMLALSLGIAFLSSFIPVYMIAKKRPVEAIRSA